MAGQKEETTVLSAADEEQEQEERLLEDVAVLDFDMLCATVAMQTQGFSVGNTGKVGGGGGEEEGEFGGVQRMWEGEVLHCFEDRRIALETVCCPCYRFGKNMERAGFGTSCLQGTVYVVLVAVALLNYVAFGVTRRHSFLYLAVAFTILIGTYLGLFRTQIRKQFNITLLHNYKQTHLQPIPISLHALLQSCLGLLCCMVLPCSTVLREVIVPWTTVCSIFFVPAAHYARNPGLWRLTMSKMVFGEDEATRYVWEGIVRKTEHSLNSASPKALL